MEAKSTGWSPRDFSPSLYSVLRRTAPFVIAWSLGLWSSACGKGRPAGSSDVSSAEASAQPHAQQDHLAPGSDDGTVFNAGSPSPLGAATIVDAAATEPPRGMVIIAAGSFDMGSRTSPDESPVHRVRVGAFEMDVTEVTAQDFSACVAAGACDAIWQAPACNAGRAERATHPINCVSWFQADAFCRWRNKRLPSEEEWEYAARGAQASKYPWGDAGPDGRVCWRRGMDQLGTCRVRSYPNGVSPFGVFDMAGNVWEWTASGSSKNYSRPRGNAERVMRGGGWGDVDPDYISATSRGHAAPDNRSYTHGFRCARTIDAADAGGR
jgi:formylglycine-generating enzyme required for sulfatase activity